MGNFPEWFRASFPAGLVFPNLWGCSQCPWAGQLPSEGCRSPWNQSHQRQPVKRGWLCESQCFPENGFLESGDSVLRSVSWVLSRLAPGVGWPGPATRGCCRAWQEGLCGCDGRPGGEDRLGPSRWALSVTWARLCIQSFSQTLVQVLLWRCGWHHNQLGCK